MFAKGRRPWKRGAKMRYSVYKSEDRAAGEKAHEKWARDMADKWGYDLNEFCPSFADRNFWQETYDRMTDYWRENVYWPSLKE